MGRVAIVKLAGSLVDARRLIWYSAIHDVRALYSTSIAGVGWLFMKPFFQVCIYLLVFMVILKLRGGNVASDYILQVLGGITPWLVMSSLIQQSTVVLRARTELVKEVVFPIEILPVSALVLQTSVLLVGLAVYLIVAAFHGALEISIFLYPVPVFLLFAFILGVSWMLMVVGSVIPDCREILSILFTVLIFVSPVFLNQTLVGEEVWPYILLNPFSHMIIPFQDVLRGTFHPLSWFIMASMSLFCLIIGGHVIVRARRVIGEYI